MKKRYLTPTIDFEILEQDEMIMKSWEDNDNAQWKLDDPDETDNQYKEGNIGVVDDWTDFDIQ